jgi:hypothetical membrane protein
MITTHIYPQKVKRQKYSYITDWIMNKDINLTRFFGLCGILAPIIGLTCIFIAISYLPWFSWTENYLSDIGGNPGSDCLWSTWGIASVIFNFGIIAAGSLGFLFAIGMKQSKILNSRLGDVGIMFFAADSIALIGIGVFTESTGDWHIFFFFAFFILIGIGLAIIGIALLKLNEKKLGWLTIGLLIFGLCAVPLFFTPQPLGSNAIAEIIPVISLTVFSIVFGYKLFNLKIKEDDTEKQMMEAN